MRRTWSLSLLGLAFAASCEATAIELEPLGGSTAVGRAGRIQAAHLGRAHGDPQGLAALRAAFAAANPGYDIEYVAPLIRLDAVPVARVLFVQTGAGDATVTAVGRETSVTAGLSVGDVVLVRAGETLRAEGGLSVLCFRVPLAPPAGLPTFVRPDWDPGITDTPGGCAEESGAYRRICLTWRPEVGRYVWHALNAHRVRIEDSFSHYHPVEGGFDELYLVQAVQPGAQLVTSERVGRIERPDEVTAAEAATLLVRRELSAGDLLYLPRGTMHRGLGGVLTQVVTVPGFVPGAEIGLDHHLRAICERLGLAGGRALPYHAAASLAQMVK